MDGIRAKVLDVPAFEAKNTPIFAYASYRHLMIDLDGVTLGYAKRIAQYCAKEFQAGDCLVVQSSHGGYHLVYNNTIDWEEILWIMWTLVVKGIVRWKFYAWNKTRANITLRLSTKWYKVLKDGRHGTKMRPRPIAYLSHKSDRGDSNILEYCDQAGFEV